MLHHKLATMVGEVDLPGLGGDLFALVGSFDGPLSEASTAAVPMMTMMYYIKNGRKLVFGWGR